VEKYLERPERDVRTLAATLRRGSNGVKNNITDKEINRHSVIKVQTWLKQSIEPSARSPWNVGEVSIIYLFNLSVCRLYLVSLSLSVDLYLSLSLTSSELDGHRPLKGPTLSRLRVVNLQIKLSYSL
jgi:hypothetical protein